MATKILPITGLTVGDVGPAALVCGDPGRAARIAEHLDNKRLLSQQRGYDTYQGFYKGVPVTVGTHGVGAPGAALAFEELVAAGAKQIIRVGSCGGLQPDLEPGELVVATAAVQHTGYGRETVPAGYPAVADLDLSLALRDMALAAGLPCRTGIILTRDNFYAGVRTPATADYPTLSAANVLAVEMECAALFIVGSLRRVQTAAILAVDGNLWQSGGESMDTYQPHRPAVQAAVEAEIQIALETLKRVQTA